MAILVALDQHFHQMNLKAKKGTHHFPRLVLQRGDSTIQLSPKLCKMIVRFICGSVLGREEISKLLEEEILCHLEISRPSQYLNYWKWWQVSKKPARHKYVEIPDEPVDPSQLKMTMIKVNKETEIWLPFVNLIVMMLILWQLIPKKTVFFSENFERRVLTALTTQTPYLWRMLCWD